jgi:copper transport protein
LNPFAALLAALALAFAILGLSAAPANAHAVLVSSSPTDGARLDSAPAAVTLTFDESVRLVPAAAQVISVAGIRADTGTAHLSADGTTIVIPLRPQLPQGSYAATWRVVSADTHIVSGSISFGLGQDPGGPAPTTADHARPLTLAADVARGVLYLGLVLSAGMALVCRTLWPWALGLPRMRALLIGGWTLLAIATLGQFLLQGPQSLNLGWAGVFSSDAVADTLASRTGMILIVRGVIIAALGVALRFDRRGSTVAIAICSAAVALTIVIDGHAGVGEQVWLATAVTAMHVLAMAVWLGGLVALCVAVFPSGRTANLRRWSLAAFVCVSVLILSGEYQAWRQVRPVESMWSTSYGITLSVKLAIVTAMLAIAYISQRRLDPKVLRRTVPGEMALGLAVVVATSALVSQAPARTTYGPPVSLSAPLDSRSALIRVDTTRRGPTTISVTPLDATGHPIHATSVSGTLSSDDAGIAALNVKFQPASDDQWHSSYAVVPLPGSWTFKLVVEFSTSDAIATAARFRVW